MAALLALVLLAAGLVATPAHSAPAFTTVSFSPTGSSQTWSVPAGVQSVFVSMAGGMGGTQTAPGQRFANTLNGTLTIPPGATSLEINVGTAGAPAGFDGAGGWNGGGAGGAGTSAANTAGGGGGATDIRLPGAAASQALMVAGGTGGDGGFGGGDGDDGGAGGVGGLAPSSGASSDGSLFDFGGAGGAGGTVSGATGEGGQAATSSNNGAGGGGGGGWTSGAAGSAGTAPIASGVSVGGGGGGGGRSYVDTTYVAGATESAAASSFVSISYLTVSVGTIPTLLTGVSARWSYSAGTEVVYSLASGSLPPGMSLDGYNGIVAGTPTTAGNYTFTVAASAFPDGTHPVTTHTTTTVSVGSGGAGTLVATSTTDVGTTTATGHGVGYAGASLIQSIVCAYWTANPGAGSPTPNGYSTSTSPSIIEPTDTGASTPITCSFTGLTGNTTYWYRIIANQQGNVLESNTLSFTTGSALPTIATSSASNVTSTTATGNGTLTTVQNTSAIVCKFATTIQGVATGTSVNATPSSTTGTVANRSLTCSMTGLTANTRYHYAFFATDSAGTATSPTIETFETAVAPPVVGTATAGSVGSASALITGSVTPTNETVTSIYCRYTTSPGSVRRGTVVAASPFQADGRPVKRNVTCSLGGLAASTTYTVVVEATDRDGTAASTPVQFTTIAAGGGGASGGGGGGASPEPAPTTPDAPTSQPSTPPALPSTETLPPAQTVVRLLPGLSLLTNPVPGSVTRTKAIRSATVRAAAPNVKIVRDRPTSIVVRGLEGNRSVMISVRAEKRGPWARLGSVTSGPRGQVTVPPLIGTRARQFLIRLTLARGDDRFISLRVR